MAYLYKGMAAPGDGADVSGSVLLTWHEKVSAQQELRMKDLETSRQYPSLWMGFADRQLTEVAGVGCIVRVMTDRRTL